MSTSLRDQPGRAGFSARHTAARIRLLVSNSIVLRLVVLVSALTGPLLVATPASAHADFDYSEPAEGEPVNSPLVEVTLVFTGPVQPIGEQFVVLDPELGVREPTSVQSPDQQVWTLTFEPPLSAGDVGIRWTVQAGDAHAITGGTVLTVLPSSEVSATETTGADSGTDDTTISEPEAADAQSDIDEGADVPDAAGSPDAADDRGGSFDQTAPVSTDDEADGELTSSQIDGAGNGDSIDVGLGASLGSQGGVEDFVTGGKSRLAGASFVAAVGRAVGYTGAMAAIGGFLFAQLVLRRRRDLENAVVWLRRFGLLILLGAGLEVGAQVVIEVGEWSFAGLADLLSSPFGLSVGLRFLGGLAWWGLPEPDLAGQDSTVLEADRSFERQLSPVVGAAGSPPSKRPSRSDRGRELSETFTEYRWQSGASSSLAVLGLVLLTIAHIFDGHTLSEGNRALTSFATAVHVIGGAVWGGGVIMLAATLWNRRRDRAPLEAMELGIRFSILASVAAVVVGAAGMVLAWSILDSISSLWTTPWGRLLLIKLAVVALAGAMGFYNHRTLLPSAVRSRSVIGSSPAGVRLRMAVGVEAMVMVTAIVVTALLVGAAS